MGITVVIVIVVLLDSGKLSLVPCPLLLQDSIISKDINYSGSINAFPIINIGLKNRVKTEILSDAGALSTSAFLD